MKKKFLSFCLNTIKETHPDIDEIKLDEIRYGLEGIYLTVTKSVVIFSLAALLGIFKEMIILLIFFNILRSTGFGLHATKSWICLLFSSMIFTIFPFLAKAIYISQDIKIILGAIAILLIFKYAPSDTIKRPIISEKRRNKFKFITTLKTICLVFLMIFINNQIISNLILFGIYTEIVMILPITYKMFNLSYNNYLNYIPN